MKDLFYITEPQEGLYNLRFSGNFTCLHSGRSLDKVMECITSYVVKYQNDPKKLGRMVKKLNYNKGIRCSEEGKELLAKEYEQRKDLYSDQIELAVEQGLNKLNKKPTLNTKKEGLTVIPVNKPKKVGGVKIVPKLKTTVI